MAWGSDMLRAIVNECYDSELMNTREVRVYLANSDPLLRLRQDAAAVPITQMIPILLE
jgi:hypothetical protein